MVANILLALHSSSVHDPRLPNFLSILPVVRDLRALPTLPMYSKQSLATSTSLVGSHLFLHSFLPCSSWFFPWSSLFTGALNRDFPKLQPFHSLYYAHISHINPLSPTQHGSYGLITFDWLPLVPQLTPQAVDSLVFSISHRSFCFSTTSTTLLSQTATYFHPNLSYSLASLSHQTIKTISVNY